MEIAAIILLIFLLAKTLWPVKYRYQLMKGIDADVFNDFIKKFAEKHDIIEVNVINHFTINDSVFYTAIIKYK